MCHLFSDNDLLSLRGSGTWTIKSNHCPYRWPSRVMSNATMCTPEGYGAADSRWDTWRICEFAEILGFYGLQYWYTWQVTVLGLGPIWMSENEAIKKRAAEALEQACIVHGVESPSGDARLKSLGHAQDSAMLAEDLQGAFALLAHSEPLYQQKIISDSILYQT